VSTSFSTGNPALRGLWTRGFAMALGALGAAVIIVAMQLPLMNRAEHATVTLRSLDGSGAPSTLAWPSVGSAALVIPALGVERSWHDAVVPIASLTKLMTAYVVLKRLPLAQGRTGPCTVVTTSDVQAYDFMRASGQSSVAVSVGEPICELDLLKGLLIHSASNYALMLANMTLGTPTAFIAAMNATAQSLGFVGTHYADVAGYDDRSVSTALDQGLLAEMLMRSPLVRSIVDQTSVTLPFAGTVNSFTPYVGLDDVIGVKSGRTIAAGGCDVMAITFALGGTTGVAYAVVLGQRGGDLLGPAGDAALALDRSALASGSDVVVSRSTVIGRLGWSGQNVPVVVAHRESFFWWGAKGAVPFSVRLLHFTRTIHRGQLVGWLRVRAVRSHAYPLVAGATVSPPSLWQRLR